MCHKTVLSSRLSVSQLKAGRMPSVLFLLFRGGFLGGSFRRLCFWFVGLDGFYLLRLRFLLGKVGSFEALSANGDLGDAHGGEGLAMAAQFLVLLLALVVEDQDFRTAALLDDLADYARVGLLADLTGLAGYGQHIGELHLAIGAGAQFLDSNHIARRHPVLLATGADNRVHKPSSIECRENSARRSISNGTSQARARTPAQLIAR